MMNIYRGSINASPSTDFVQTFRAGNLNINVCFRWDLINEEIYASMSRSIQTMRDADPLLKGAQIVRDYDYLSWYIALPNTAEEIEEMLEGGMEYPQSLRKLANNLKANQLLERKQEALEIQHIIEPFANNSCWHLTIYDDEDNRITADLRPNAWIGNQRQDWRVRILSDLTEIGKDDLVLCTIEVAVSE